MILKCILSINNNLIKVRYHYVDIVNGSVWIGVAGPNL